MRGKHFGKWICLAGTAILLVCAVLALHDMQTAEGAGLYLAGKANAQNRLPYDLFVDGAGMVSLLLFLFVPCIFFKHLRLDSLLRFTSACLAFLPVVSMGALVHLADGTGRILLSQSLLEGRLGDALLEGLGDLFPILAAGMPLLLLARAADRAGGEDGKVTHWPSGMRLTVMMAQLLFVIAAVLFPMLTALCHYFMVYVFLVCGFFVWERLCERSVGRNGWSWLLFGLFWLRGIERMLELMSVYHL